MWPRVGVVQSGHVLLGMVCVAGWVGGTRALSEFFWTPHKLLEGDRERLVDSTCLQVRSLEMIQERHRVSCGVGGRGTWQCGKQASAPHQLCDPGSSPSVLGGLEGFKRT